MAGSLGKAGHSRRAIADINVTPFVDVMLVLLVIFMITAPLLNLGVEVQLPKADAEPMDTQENDEPLVITVLQNGDLYLNAGGDLDGTSLRTLDPDGSIAASVQTENIVGDPGMVGILGGRPTHRQLVCGAVRRRRSGEYPAWNQDRRFGRALVAA